MKRSITKISVILCAIGIFFFGTAGPGYAETGEFDEAAANAYRELMREDPELAAAFKEEVLNFKEIHQKEMEQKEINRTSEEDVQARVSQDLIDYIDFSEMSPRVELAADNGGNGPTAPEIESEESEELEEPEGYQEGEPGQVVEPDPINDSGDVGRAKK